MLKNFTLNHPSLNSEKFVQNQTLIYLSIKVYKSKSDQLTQGGDGDYCSILECLPGFLT